MSNSLHPSRPGRQQAVAGRKPRILLIPNVAWWIIGEMGKQIVARFGDRYDFFFVPEGIFERRPELLAAMLPAVDAVHCLNESSIDLFRDRDRSQLPPIATWIHHVTQWSPQHQLSTELSSALTVCTTGWKQDIAARIGPTPPITVVPHGVDLQFFRPREVPAGAFGIPPGKFVVGFLGSKGSDADAGRKGTDTLLEVIRSAAQQVPDLHVVLGGPGWESELGNLRALGVSVSVTGFVPKQDLPQLYSAMDAYLMTSRVEGGPCTIFESMACGTPVIATRVGAVPELVVDGVNGFSAAVGDAPALVRAIVELSRDPDKRRTIAAAAQETVSRLPWSVALNSLEPLYDALTLQADAQARAQARTPRWMRDTQKILRTSSAADAVSYTIARVRGGKQSLSQALRSLEQMMDGTLSLDLIRGLAMLRGWTYKPGAPATAGNNPGANANSQRKEAV